MLSKVSQAVQALNITLGSDKPSQQAPEQPATSPDSVLQVQSPKASSPSAQQAAEGVVTDKLRQAQQSQASNSTAADGEDWQRASSSHNAARKRSASSNVAQHTPHMLRLSLASPLLQATPTPLLAPVATQRSAQSAAVHSQHRVSPVSQQQVLQVWRSASTETVTEHRMTRV